MEKAFLRPDEPRIYVFNKFSPISSSKCFWFYLAFLPISLFLSPRVYVVSKWMREREHWTSVYVWVFAADSCPANAIARLFIAYFIFKPNIHIRSIEWLAHLWSIHQSMLTEMFAVLTKKRWASKREIIIKINGWHIYCYGRYVLMFVIYIFQWTLSKECIVQFSFDFVNFYCYRFGFCRCCSLII